jgi:hypothetical protein
MDALAGPYLAAAALLVVAGAGKLLDPLPLVRAMRSVGLPSPPLLVRAAAAGELALGLLAAASGSRAAALAVAASYTAFTAFVLLALRRGGVLASCGCFGTADTPPTATHAVVTAGFAVVAGAVAVRPYGSLPDLLAGSPWSGLPLLLASGAVAATAYLVLAVLPLLKARPA